MPNIPVNVDDLPTDYDPLPDDISYRGVIRSLEIKGPDKNGDDYLKVSLEVTEPEEWAGRRTTDNYIGIPGDLDALSGPALRQAREKGVRLARFIKAFKIPYSSKGIDTDAAIGCEGAFTVKVEMYQDRPMSKPNDYLI